MTQLIGSFLAISDEKREAKLTVVARNGERREISASYDEMKRLVEKMRAQGISGRFSRSERPKVNVRELVAAL